MVTVILKIGDTLFQEYSVFPIVSVFVQHYEFVICEKTFYNNNSTELPNSCF